MLKKLVVVCFLVVTSLTFCFGQNLVQNGSFEQPALTGCSFGQNCNIPLWDVSGCGGSPNLIIPACASGNPNASDGNQALQIYSNTNNGFMTISQTINVTPGCTYQFSFDYSSVYSPIECFDWSLTGGFGGTAVGTVNWQSVSFTFEPTTTTVTMSFINTATNQCPGSTNSGNYTSPQLDNVVLIEIDCDAQNDTTETFLTDCDSLIFEGITYFDSDTIEFNGTNTSGGDSTHFTYIQISESSITNLEEQICEGYNISIDNQTFDATGNYQVVLSNAEGCDSVVNLDLTVIQGVGQAPDETFFNTGTDGSGGVLTGGENDLQWQVALDNIDGVYNPAVIMSSIPGNYYNSPWPDATWIAHNPNGSHSADQDFFYKIEFDLACQDICGGNFEDPNVLCLNLDFFADNSVLEIYVNGIPQSSQIADIPVAGNPYTHIGFNQANMLTVSLCENWQPGSNELIIQVVSGPPFAGFLAQTSINPPEPIISDTIPTLLCEGDTLPFDTLNVFEEGFYTATFVNSFGCDSTVTIDVEVVLPDSTFENQSTCNPTDTGFFVSTFQNFNGCDSIFSLEVSLLPSDTTFETTSSCNPTDTGVVENILSNQFGCDSLYIVTTTLLPSDTTSEVQLSCNPVDTGLFDFNLTNQFGCDSIHSVQVDLAPSDSTFENASSCNPIDTGVAVNSLTNQFGCDSIHTITTTLLFSDTTFSDFESCNPLDTGTFSESFINLSGCDSTHFTTINLLPSDSTFENESTCFENEIGEITTTFSNQFGCDSTHTITTALAGNIYSVEPDFAVITSGESLPYNIVNQDNNLVFEWESSQNESCEAACLDFEVTPTDEVNFYYFTLTDTLNDCVFQDTMRVDVEFFSSLDIPNIFTPNNDGENDIFRVYGSDIFEFTMMIFDRWGGKIYESNDLNEGWDGTFKGQPVSSGIYIAIIKATGIDAKQYDVTRNIKLVR